MTRHSRPGSSSRNQNIFKVLRFFSLSSLISIMVAAILLTALFRQVAIRDMIHFGEQSNQQLAQSFLNAVRAPLLPYIGTDEYHHGLPVPPEVVQAIAGLMHNTGVTRVKIYDDEGIVLFSTPYNQIGTDGSGNPGFKSGMKGRVVSELTYRDAFNPFDWETESDNLIQTYIPIQQSQAEPILGVFEIYSDVHPLVVQIERAEFLILGGSIAILALLYLALLAIVRHAERIITAQQNTIRDRNHALELLSAQLLKAQEDDRKRLAYELHEGIAQTLSGIKYQMETACQPNGRPFANDRRPADTLVLMLQSAIQKVRTLAMDLRPSSLDDLGLLPTLDWYCQEFRSIYPDIELRLDTQVEESDISKNLKLVLFRLIQQIVQNIARQICSSRVRIELHKSGDQILLEITDDCLATTMSSEKLKERELYLLTLRERITLSGGDMEVFTSDDVGGTTVRASWWS